MQRGHLLKLRNGGWAVRWREPDPQKPGKQRLRQTGGFRTKELAKQWLADKLDEVQMAGSNYRPDMTISELIVAFKEQRAPTSNHRETSLRSHLKKIEERFGGVKLSALDVAAINAWRNTLKPGSRWDIITDLRMLLNFAARVGYLPRPIARQIENPQPTRGVRAKRKAFQSPDQVEAIVAEMPSEYRGIPLFLLATGMRPGEMIPLEHADIDYRTNTIHLQRAQGLREETMGKKKAIPRRVPLWPDALRAIEMTPRRLDSPLVFPAMRTGGKIRLSTLEEIWKRAVFAAGIEPFRELYDLRHTHISWALRAGIPASDVADWCGTSIVQIHKVYRHLIPGAETEAISRMTKLTKYLREQAAEEGEADERS